MAVQLLSYIINVIYIYIYITFVIFDKRIYILYHIYYIVIYIYIHIYIYIYITIMLCNVNFSVKYM